ncbi:MAG: hypothetical protein KC592_07025 [Nitrospira sp.]|nr:hypothetical protein [Nitrospira sp.]HBP89229.1 hypothetical protein [Nitrospiraceae bacterium]HNP28910.1 DUF4065 domain-containing protein [Nitrospirales bacterium]
MRKPSEVTGDRALLIYTLHMTESMGLMSDVKLQQLLFLCELQMLGKGLKGLHFEFVRFPYGAFSKDVDNDLLFLRRKERIENFDVTEQAERVVSLVDRIMKEPEVNQQVMEIIHTVVEKYGPMDTSAIMSAVEAVELGPADNPEQKLAIRDISFHTIMLVPSRIEATDAMTLSPAQVKTLNAAMGY